MAVEQLIASGKFSQGATAAAKDIVLRSDFDSFEVVNYTQSIAAGAGQGVKFYWQKGFADGVCLQTTKTTTTNALAMAAAAGSGMLRVDEGDQSIGAAQALVSTFITDANPAVATATAHGYSVGDRVIFNNTTSMLQVAGIPFEITAADANTFTLGYLNASGFASAATAGNVRRLPRRPLFQPEKLYITNISQASSAVVTFSFAHNLVVGQKIRFAVSSANGMSQMDGLVGEVTAISTANNTATVNIDSSAFTAWAWPTSAVAAAGWSPAHANPVGEVATITSQAEVNSGRILMRLSAGANAPAGAANDVIYWRAFKSALDVQE